MKFTEKLRDFFGLHKKPKDLDKKMDLKIIEGKARVHEKVTRELIDEHAQAKKA